MFLIRPPKVSNYIPKDIVMPKIVTFLNKKKQQQKTPYTSTFTPVATIDVFTCAISISSV